MTDEGLVDMAPGRAVHKHGGLPRVTVFLVAAVEGDVVWAVPEHWEASGPPPRVRVMDKGRKGALGVGDPILARTEARGTGHVAYPIKPLQPGGEIGVGFLVPDTRARVQPGNLLRPAAQTPRLQFFIDKSS